ncbi:MAG: TolC family outer membrane protein, partial [Hylemonella sp.]
MKQQLLSPLALAALTVLSMSARAQSLSDLYDAARQYDAAYQSAKSQYQATMAVSEEADQQILPTVNLSVTGSNGQVNVIESSPNRSYTNQGISMSASQPLYRPGNIATYRQGKKQIDVAQAAIQTAEQDLIVRTSQAYFDVLNAQDTLTFVQAQKTAVAEQLASAKRNFEVGTATITDTREAQARFDLVVAQEIAAENDLRVKNLALNQLVGRSNTTPKPLASIDLPNLLPDNVNTWIQQALDGHPSLKQLKATAEIARLEVEKAKAGHKPTLDMTASYGYTENINGTAISASTSKSAVGVVGLSFNLPLFSGFYTQNRIKETLALAEKASSDLEAAQRNISQATRAAFFGVLSGLGQVKALQAAETSSQSALDANKLGYQVGVRINIDVLNSQSQLFQTKRDLAKARYDVLVGGLKLRQANGSLKAEDLQSVNTLL